jgi:hypothetical protein
MTDAKDHMLRAIEASARREAKCLASEFARAASEQKEAILASLEIERWLATSCRDARF